MTEVWPPTEATKNSRNDAQQFEHPCNYIVSKTPLGQGSYSSVFECKHIKTKKHYAAKRYKKTLVFGLEDMLQNEFSVLKSISLDHKNLLSLVDYFETEKYIYLVTNLAKGGELFDKITNNASGRLTEAETARITAQLVDTIDHLHSHNIVHRDIKAENILLQSSSKTSPQILLADFGLARIIHENQASLLYDKCGTLSYMAPEMFDRQGYSFSVDIWALGVTVYFMLCGYMPFDCETDDETTTAIKTGDFMFEPAEYWDHISPQAKDFLCRCFVVDPAQRMTASEAAMHPFVTTAPTNRDSKAPGMYPSIGSVTTSTNTNRNSLFSAYDVTMSNSTSTSNFTQSLHTSASNVSLFQRLRESLQNVQSTSSSERMAVAYSTTSSSSSLSQDIKLRGALCESPNAISRFTTPTHSTNVSRVQSLDQLNFMPVSTAPETKKNETTFFL